MEEPGWILQFFVEIQLIRNYLIISYIQLKILIMINLILPVENGLPISGLQNKTHTLQDVYFSFSAVIGKSMIH